VNTHQLVILETLKSRQRPVATKTLFINKKGERDTLNYGRAARFNASIHTPKNIEELSALLTRFVDNPYALVVRGKIRDHIDISQPIWRRKDEKKYPKAPHTVCLEETALPWIMLDVDKLSLYDLGFDAPLHQLNPIAVCDAIIAKYIPELKSTSYHYQLSSTAGWKNPHTVSVHLWFWLDRPWLNTECKAFARFINAREGQNILDPALYQAAQPHYIANPILGIGVDQDPIKKRTGLVQKAYDTLSLPIFELPDVARKTAQKRKLGANKGNKKAATTQPPNPYIRPTSIEGWLSIIKQTDNGIHQVLLDVTLWRAVTGGLWCDWSDFRVQVEQALKESVRGQKDLERIEAIFRDGEYDRAVEGAKNIAKQRFWQNYSSHLLLSHDDTVKINERYLHSLQISKTLVIDSDLGTGKTEWFYRQVIKGAPLGNKVICLNPRRSLAKATAERFGIVDYEDAKKAGKKGRHDMDTRMMSVCTNSSLILINPQNPLDVVFLDESDLNIQHLLGGAVPDNIREDLIYHNLEMVRHAEYVICAQSLISDLTLTFLELAGRDDIVKVVNTHQPWKEFPIDFFRKKDRALERLIEIANKGTAFLCPCNSSGQALRNYLHLKERFPDKNYLLITNDTATEPEQSAFLANPNKHGHKYDGIIFSPSMETGVSIDVEHFVEVIGFCSAAEKVGTPEAFIQMILRGRKVKRISLWVDPQKRDLPTTDERVAREAIGRFDVTAKFVETDQGTEAIQFEMTPAVKLAMKARAIENKSKNNTDLVVYALLTERMGCDVRLIDSTPSEMGLEAHQEGVQLHKDYYQSHIENAAPITAFEYETIKEKKTPTFSENWEIRRYHLENELCLDLDKIPDDRQALFDLWSQGRVVNQLRGFEEGMLTLEQAKAVARHLLDTKAPYSEIQGFSTRYLIRKGIMESLKITVDSEGNVSCSPDFKFRYADLMSTWWYRFARHNRDAVNGSRLGCRIKGKRPSEKEIGMWIRAMGIVLTRQKVDGPDPASKPLKEKKGGSGPNRQRKSVFSVNIEKMQALIPILKRRYQGGVSAWVSLASKVLSENPVDNAHESCEEVIKTLLPNLKVSGGDETVIALSEHLGGRFERLEVAEVYFRLVG